MILREPPPIDMCVLLLAALLACPPASIGASQDTQCAKALYARAVELEDRARVMQMRSADALIAQQRGVAGAAPDEGPCAIQVEDRAVGPSTDTYTFSPVRDVRRRPSSPPATSFSPARDRGRP
jgi:hypothetical protein